MESLFSDAPVKLRDLLLERLGLLRVEVAIAEMGDDAFCVMLVLHFHSSELANVNVVPVSLLGCHPACDGHIEVEALDCFGLAVLDALNLAVCDIFVAFNAVLVAVIIENGRQGMLHEGPFEG